jgi:hypothetical protein
MCTLSLLPAIVASWFFITFLKKDEIQSRANIIAGCKYMILSALIIMVWKVLYYAYMYEPLDAEFDQFKTKDVKIGEAVVHDLFNVGLFYYFLIVC